MRACMVGSSFEDMLVLMKHFNLQAVSHGSSAIRLTSYEIHRHAPSIIERG